MASSIIFLNRFYWPDLAATGQQLTDLAEDLATEGWHVTVITSRSRYAHGSAHLPRQEVRNGVHIHRVRTTRFGQLRTFGRVLDYLSYFAGATVRLLTGPRAQVVVAMCDPPFIVGAAVLAGKLRGSRSVYYLQDFYPYLAQRLQLLRDGPVYRLLERAARALHRRCDAVITLGDQMTRLAITEGAHPERTVTLPNWVDVSSVYSVPAAENPFVAEQGLAGKFVVLYSGNAGRAHTFETVKEAMLRLRSEPDVHFVFIGGGKKMGDLRRFADHHRLNHVRFLGYLPRDQIRFSLSAASVSLVTEEPSVVGMLVPSKTYGILASGRALLFVGSDQSDVAAVVRDAGCGLIVPPGDAEALVGAIQRLRHQRAETEAMGRRGREAAESRYDRRYVTGRWAATVRALLKGSPLAWEQERATGCGKAD